MSRRKTRELTMQAIYQWQLNPMTVAQLQQQFIEANDVNKVDFDLFKQCLSAVINETSEIDALFMPLLDRDITDLDPVELAILRLSTYELRSRLDVPYKVVINEAIELGKKFAGTDGHKYINSILDKLAPTLRQSEVQR